MALKIYNTLSRKKEEFTPVENGKVKMYVCGMTVYSDAHIGHARTYFAFDVIRRYFEYKGLDVTYVQNITDVDDKIINAANKEGIDALEYSRRFTDRCLKDLDKLGIRRADIYPKASETIPDMIKMIQDIIDNGYGYKSNGDVYFSVEKFKDYGKLSGVDIEEMKSNRCNLSGELKHNDLDFALWKKAKPGEPSWDSPWGKGRPGWHIECSTMSSKYLGLPFDIHGGGMDLRFPHHENEIAQAEAATKKQFVKNWMHIGLLTISGDKMSKSLGNIVNIRELLEKWDAEVVRLFFASAHYRSPPDFNEKALKDSEKGLTRMYRLKEKLEDLSKDTGAKIEEKSLNREDKKYLEIIKDFKDRFEAAMDDDFNTPHAVAEIFDFINKSNKYLVRDSNPNKTLCKKSLDILIKLGNILTLFQKKTDVDSSLQKKDLSVKLQRIIEENGKKTDEKNVEKLMVMILNIREEVRNKKDWNAADKIRNELKKIGFEIQDTDKGPTWRRN